MKRPRYGAVWELLKNNSNLRRLLLAQSFLYIGDSVYSITILWLVFAQSHSAFVTGLLLVSGFFPEIVFGTYFGYLADRFNRKKIMAVSSVAQATLVIFFALVIRMDHFNLIAIFVFTTAISVSSMAFPASRAAMLPEIVNRETLIPVNSIFSAVRQVMRILGSSMGGMAIVFFGPSIVIALDAASLILVACCVLRIRYQPAQTDPDQTVEQSLMNHLTTGVRWLRGQRLLVTLILLGVVSNMALGPTNVLPQC